MGRAVAFRFEGGKVDIADELPAALPGLAFHYRVVTFARPRGPWRNTHEEAMQDAIAAKLTAYDRSQRQHYLAVPTDIEVRRVPR